MILADTSIWVDHLRGYSAALAEQLDQTGVLMHPFVLGELACGNIRNRTEELKLLGNLPRSPVALNDEVLVFIEERELMGSGVGYIDVHLLAAVTLHGTARLWTRDRRLHKLADEMELAYSSS